MSLPSVASLLQSNFYLIHPVLPSPCLSFYLFSSLIFLLFLLLHLFFLHLCFSFIIILYPFLLAKTFFRAFFSVLQLTVRISMFEFNQNKKIIQYFLPCDNEDLPLSPNPQDSSGNNNLMSFIIAIVLWVDYFDISSSCISF